MTLLGILRMRIISAFIIVMAISGCGNECKVDPDMISWSSENEDCVSLTINPSVYNEFITDTYILKEAYINMDSLKIEVQYGGGCGDAAFGLLTDGYFKESFPVQLDIRLILKDTDPCEALVQKSLCYDLSKLSEIYNNSYQTTSGTIILHCKDQDVTLEYHF